MEVVERDQCPIGEMKEISARFQKWKRSVPDCRNERDQGLIGEMKRNDEQRLRLPSHMQVSVQFLHLKGRLEAQESVRLASEQNEGLLSWSGNDWRACPRVFSLLHGNDQTLLFPSPSSHDRPLLGSPVLGNQNSNQSGNTRKKPT